ncbi:hypothetical protein KHA80_10440 [Anaerobacillus sp. HL2]|nr:hypothetical protein KHA80_10440 [Anaerobacillus sp. HL2]
MKWDQTVTISDEVRVVSHNTSLSNVLLEQMNNILFVNCMNPSLFTQQMGATMALAEAISGSYPEFVKLI